MRRIATLLATGAVAAVAAVTLAGSPAVAATNTFGGTASTTAGGSELMAAAAATHSWKTHYNTPTGVSGKGSYSFTKAKHLKISGTVTDTRTGSYYACVRFKAVDAHGNGVILTIKNTKHGTTGSFSPYVTNFRAYHLYIAKCDITKTAKKPKTTGAWFKRF
jgi:hypothetical protein